MENGCEVSFICTELPDFVLIGPLQETMVGNVRVWDLRNCKEVIIPEGTEEIGNHWFYGCGVKSLILPVSMKCIGVDAFCNCTSLRNIQFSNGLEIIGTSCFWNSGLEDVVLPASVKSIGSYAFYGCE